MPGDCFNGNLNMLEVKEQRAQYEVKVMKQIRNLYYQPPPPYLKYMSIVQMILSDLLLIILIIIAMMIMNSNNNDETRNKIDRIYISSR